MPATHPGALPVVWFTLIGVLWVGYFFLEGFDFGVGVLLPFLSRDDVDRRVLVNTIGATWDANEVWLLVAGGATFAAFPRWYATVFSGFYLALLLILLALIVRGVAFEYRSKDRAPRWRASWDRAIFVGSALPALLWGVAFADFVSGVPIGAGGLWVNGFWHLVKPYALLGGLTTLGLFCLHGATFLTLRTTGELHDRARRAVRVLQPAVTGLVTGFLAWTYLVARHEHHTGLVPGPVPVLAIVAVAAVGWLAAERLEGWSFVATGLTIVLLMATLLLNLYPRVLVSSVAPRFDLTIAGTASAHYTLVVMTVVAGIFTPFVLLYQGWSYWVFRQRVRRPAGSNGSEPTPVAPGPAGG